VDVCCTLRWRFVPRRVSGDRAAIEVLRILDRRAALARHPRPPGCTPRDWFLPAARSTSCAAALERVLDLADRAVHAPASMTFDDRNAVSEVSAICREVVHCLSLRRLGSPERQRRQSLMLHDHVRNAREFVKAIFGRVIPRNRTLEFGEANS
jgi:hypothetical protein